MGEQSIVVGEHHRRPDGRRQSSQDQLGNALGNCTERQTGGDNQDTPQIDAISANGVRDPTEGQKGSGAAQEKSEGDPYDGAGIGVEAVDHAGQSDGDHALIHDGQETPRTDYEHQHPLVFESNGPPLGRAGGIRLEAQMCPVAFCIVIVAAFPLESGRPNMARGAVHRH